MPIYTGVLTVPSGTTLGNPATATIEIEEHTIIRFDVFFPPGCCCSVHVVARYGSEQVAPKPEGATLRGDGETISWPEEWRAPEKPCTIRFEAWSPTANYDHTILLRVITRPEAQEKAIKEERGAFKALKTFLERVIGVRR